MIFSLYLIHLVWLHQVKHCHDCGLDYYRNKEYLTPTEVLRVIDTSCKKLKVHLSINEKSALLRLMKRESSLSPWKKNKKSSAFGLGQCLKQTYKNFNMHRNYCYFCQTMLTLKYVDTRYQQPSRAGNFHRRHGFY